MLDFALLSEGERRLGTCLCGDSAVIRPLALAGGLWFVPDLGENAGGKG